MNLQKKYQLLIPIILILLNVSCSSSDIIYDYDHTQLFSNYKTYRWENVKEINQDNILFNQKLKEKVRFSVNKILTEKGLKVTNNETADFIILVYVSEQQKTNMSHQTNSLYHPWWQPCGYSLVSSYDKGSLLIDIVDKDNELTWRGLAPGFFKSKTNFNEVNQAELNNAISLILEDFPPD